MAKTDITQLTFASIYPLYVQKAERKGRTHDEVDDVICWLTGFDRAALQAHANSDATFEQFFSAAPRMHPNAALVKGVICGLRVEEIAEPLPRSIRTLDKLIDELAKGKPLAKILRA